MGIEPVPIKIFNDPESDKKFKKTVNYQTLNHNFVEKSKS